MVSRVIGFSGLSYIAALRNLPSCTLFVYERNFLDLGDLNMLRYTTMTKEEKAAIDEATRIFREYGTTRYELALKRLVLAAHERLDALEARPETTERANALIEREKRLWELLSEARQYVRSAQKNGSFSAADLIEKIDDALRTAPLS